MANSSPNAPVVARYAKALLQLANANKQADAIRAELKSLREILKANPTFKSLLSDPGVSVARRDTLLKQTFTGRSSATVLNFLGLLNSKGRIGLLGEIIDAYEDLLEEQLGNVEVDVTVSQKLTPEQLERARQKVSAALGRNAIVHQYVDESIIGGVVLRVQDKLIDASVRHQLEMMKRQLLAAAPK
jgi:F-type H+-transporting ATPase subunit delta